MPLPSRRIARSSAGDRGVRGTCRRLHAAHRVRAQLHEPRPENGRGDARAGRVGRAAIARAGGSGEQQPGRKALIFVSEGFRPAQPRAIVYAANRNGVAFYPLDPHPEPADDESLLRSIAEQTGGAASINEADLAPAIAQAIADLDQYFVLSFTPAGPADGRFHPVQVRVKRPGAQARSRSGYWAPDAALAAALAKAASTPPTVAFRPVPLEPVHPAVDRHVARTRRADERHGHVGAGRGPAAESARRVDPREGHGERREGAVREPRRSRATSTARRSTRRPVISRSRWRFRAAAAPRSTPTTAASPCRTCR